jgi:hypothetical protein
MFLTPMVDFVLFPFSPALLVNVCLWYSHGLTEYMKENEGRMHGLVENQATTCSSPFLIIWVPEDNVFLQGQAGQSWCFFGPK